MDLRQIAYVEAVARNANFTRAAAELHVAQPALSVAIRRVEAELGVRLFDRTSRRVSLTPAGTAFLHRAARVSREVDALAHEMREYAGGIRGRLRLSAWYHVEPDIVEFMREFIAANPLVDVSIQELPSAEALDALRVGDIDLAAVLVLPGVDLAALEQVILRSEPCVLGVSVTDPLASRETVSLTDLADVPFVVTRPGTGFRRWFDRMFAAWDVPPRIVIETNEAAAMMAFASVGLGAAVLTPNVAQRAQFPLRLIPLAGVSPFTLVAAWREDEHDRVVQSAIDMIRSHAELALASGQT
jgi:DNA-binding transcriptional LysR family regulator